MNERIRELELAAIAYADSKVPAENRYNDIYYSIIRRVLVNSIILECAEIVEGFTIEQEVALDQYEEYEASAVLKEHFGVEE